MGSIDSFIASRSADHAEFQNTRRQEVRLGWTPEDVVALLGRLHPPANAPAGDFEQQERQLCAAFLAGVTESRDEQPLRPGPQLASTALQMARTLLKNRAMGQQGRLWHAFMAGVHTAQADTSLASALRREPVAQEAAEPLKIFVRQPFTESDQAQQQLIADVLMELDAHNGASAEFDYLTGKQAESADTFRASFESETGQTFTPQAFRAHRLNLLAQADVFVNIRVGMSESSAFELSYHIFKGACTPVLFLVWKHAPIKTTLLKDLENLCDITYLEFEQASDLRAGIEEFFRTRQAATHTLGV